MKGAIVFADMGPPPTFVVDSLHLGWPMGAAVGFGLLAAATGVYIALRRAGWRRGMVIAVCLLGYGAANFGVYLWGLGMAAERRDEYRKQWQGQRTKPEASPGAGDASKQ